MGIEVHFAAGSAFRGIRANLIYSALLQLGEVLWFHPNFVVAEDKELERFWLTLRTCAPWEAVAVAVRESGDPGDIAAVQEVPPRYEAEEEIAHQADAPEASEAPGAPSEQPGGEPPESGGTEQRYIRVSLDRLESLSNLVGELAVERAHLANMIARLEAVCVEGEARRLAQELRRTTGKLAGVTTHLQELSTELRMVPVGHLFRRFTRLVRELSDATSKPLVLSREGEETMLDKAIIEEMTDPLLHLIRNAADHGIEPPEERRQAGKPETGRITLRAYDQGDQVVIEVEDDGRGMDAQRIRAKAIERGLLTAEEAAALSDRDALQLVFQPGFSTADRLTDISGRGVGMDVVRVAVGRLRGTIDLDTEAGRGTRVTVRLPLTVSVLDVMLAEVLDQIVAVPMAALGGLIRVSDENRMLKGSILRHQDRLVPVVDLGGLWWQRESTGASALLITSAGQEYALLVDRPLGMGDVVIKPLGDYVGRLPGVAGAAVLGDGRVALILDPSTLLTDHSHVQGGANLELAVAH